MIRTLKVVHLGTDLPVGPASSSTFLNFMLEETRRMSVDPSWERFDQRASFAVVRLA